MSEKNSLEGIDLVSSPSARFLLIEKVAQLNKARGFLSFGRGLMGFGTAAMIGSLGANTPTLFGTILCAGLGIVLTGSAVSIFAKIKQATLQDDLLNNLSNNQWDRAQGELKARQSPRMRSSPG